MSDDICAPGKKNTEGSCFTIESLKMIAKSYNNLNKKQIEITDNKKELLVKLIKNIKKDYGCVNQICWLNLDIVKNINNDGINNTFRPNGPMKKYDWLSTSDIDNVVKQYESIHKNFKYLGTVPYDFDLLPILGISNINFTNLIDNGYHKIGMVINLDNHDERGSHWVALYANLKKRQVFFFDSFGKKPGRRIKIFITKIVKFLYNTLYNKSLNIKYFFDNDNEIEPHMKDELSNLDVRYNKIQHQFSNSECGVYSINFIIRLASGESFENITNNITNDKEMNDCRKVYFRN